MSFVFLCLTSVRVILSRSCSSLPICAPLSCDSAHKDAIRYMAWHGAFVSSGAQQLPPPLPLLVSVPSECLLAGNQDVYPFFPPVLFPYLLKMLLIFHPIQPPRLPRGGFSVSLHLIHAFFPFPSSFQTHMTEI